MRHLLLFASSLVALPLLIGCGPSDLVFATQGTDLTLEPVDPFLDGSEVTVLVFISCDCPISNRYIPTLRTLQARYAQHPVRFWLVYPDPDLTAEQVERHVREYEPEIAVLRDPQHVLVDAAHVSTVPEAAVFVRQKGQQLLTYHGSIDDRFVDFGVARVEAKMHHLRDVLDAHLAGKVEVFPSLPAIGCPIPKRKAM